MAKILDFTP